MFFSKLVKVAKQLIWTFLTSAKWQKSMDQSFQNRLVIFLTLTVLGRERERVEGVNFLPGSLFSPNFSHLNCCTLNCLAQKNIERDFFGQADCRPRFLQWHGWFIPYTIFFGKKYPFFSPSALWNEQWILRWKVYYKLSVGFQFLSLRLKISLSLLCKVSNNRCLLCKMSIYTSEIFSFAAVIHSSNFL